MAHLFTYDDAVRLSLAGKPWTFALELGNHEVVFTGRGRNEPSEGYIKTTIQKVPDHLMDAILDDDDENEDEQTINVKVTTWANIEKAVPVLVQKGFTLKEHPFVRVRQETIDAWQAQQPTAVLAPPVQAPAASATPAPVAPASSDPYSRIVTVVPDPKAGNWQALDSQGKLVMRITASGARQFVQSNPNVTVGGL